MICPICDTDVRDTSPEGWAHHLTKWCTFSGECCRPYRHDKQMDAYYCPCGILVALDSRVWFRSSFMAHYANTLALHLHSGHKPRQPVNLSEHIIRFTILET